MPVPSRDETERIVTAIFGGGRVNRTSHRGTSEPLAVGEVMGDLIVAAKRRHPSSFTPRR
jgi:hypothetical protein